jgi:hypothetical protein
MNDFTLHHPLFAEWLGVSEASRGTRTRLQYLVYTSNQQPKRTVGPNMAEVLLGIDAFDFLPVYKLSTDHEQSHANSSRKQFRAQAQKLANPLYKMPLTFAPFIAGWGKHSLPVAILGLVGYVALVQVLRYRRMAKIQAPFANGTRPLSSMTVEEAHAIIAQLQELEFPRAFCKARRMALLKVRK